ncbi:hypothetical protein [Bradyrhizobium vignae]|nr:hypothetical protein [Bradyrhizobium vignae]
MNRVDLALAQNRLDHIQRQMVVMPGAWSAHLARYPSNVLPNGRDDIVS